MLWIKLEAMPPIEGCPVVLLPPVAPCVFVLPVRLDFQFVIEIDELVESGRRY